MKRSAWEVIIRLQNYILVLVIVMCHLWVSERTLYINSCVIRVDVTPLILIIQQMHFDSVCETQVQSKWDATTYAGKTSKAPQQRYCELL